jgi:protein-disulfide isomerase
MYSSSSSSSTPTPTGTSSNSNGAAKPTPQSTPLTTTVAGAQPAHFKGSQNSPVVIEEFVDFQCGTCAAMLPIFNDITSTYGSRIKFIFRNFPLTQIHPNAYDASVAAEAAGMQGKFWEMQNLLFQNQQRWSTAAGARTLFESYADTIGLDVEKFKADLSGMAAKQRVDADIQRGRSLNINSTPTILINNRPVTPEQMNSVSLKQIIDGELNKMSGGQNQTAPASATKSPEGAAVNTNSNAVNK